MKIASAEKKKFHKLVEKCSENIDESEMTYNVTLNDCENVTIYTVLFVTAFLIIIGISSAFMYFHWYLKKIETIIY